MGKGKTSQNKVHSNTLGKKTLLGMQDSSSLVDCDK